MKKLILLALMFNLAFVMQAQNNIDFGITAGYLNVRASVKGDGLTISDSASGFYAGLVVDIVATEKFHVQPELLYLNAEEGDALMLPIMGKFYIADKLNFQAGPQFVFTLEDMPDDFSSVEFGLAGGLGFDITEQFFLEGRYSFQINNSYTGPEDIKLRGNYLTLGAGFKF